MYLTKAYATSAIRIAPAMNPGNFPLGTSGSAAAAIENTASTAATCCEDSARPIHHRGRTPVSFDGPIILLLHTSRADKIAVIAPAMNSRNPAGEAGRVQSNMRH